MKITTHMKKIALICLITLFAMQSRAQTTDTAKNDNTVFDVVDKQPRFLYEGEGFEQFIGHNIHYPASAVYNHTQGQVIVQFVIKGDGSVSDTKILRSVSPDIDAEAIRVIGLSPKWKPGIQNGRKVSVRYTEPIIFKLPTLSPPITANTTDTRTNNANNTQPEAVNVEPAFYYPGGNFGDFLAENIRYPAFAKKHHIGGRVIIQFLVKTDGSISDAKILRSVSPDIDAEALRVISLSPHWRPGVQNGRKVAATMTVPINFSLPLVDDGTTLSDNDTTIYTSDYLKSNSSDNSHLTFVRSTPIHYPKTAMEDNVQGTVIIAFVVEKDGSISNVHVIKTVRKDLDDEAIRSIRASPKWYPGFLNGHAVRVSYSVPVTFNISSE